MSIAAGSASEAQGTSIRHLPVSPARPAQPTYQPRKTCLLANAVKRPAMETQNAPEVKPKETAEFPFLKACAARVIPL